MSKQPLHRRHWLSRHACYHISALRQRVSALRGWCLTLTKFGFQPATIQALSCAAGFGFMFCTCSSPLGGSVAAALHCHPCSNHTDQAGRAKLSMGVSYAWVLQTNRFLLCFKTLQAPIALPDMDRDSIKVKPDELQECVAWRAGQKHWAAQLCLACNIDHEEREPILCFALTLTVRTAG